MKFSAVLLGVLFLFCSCKTQEKQPFGRNTILENRQWLLTTLNGQTFKASERSVPCGIKFEPSGNTWGASVGCNQLNGMYTTQDDMIKLQNMAQTKMACPPESREDEFFKVLENSNRFALNKKKISGKDFYTLQLYADKQQLATFAMDTTAGW